MSNSRRRKSIVDLQHLKAFFGSIQSVAPDFIYGPPGGELLYHYTDLGGVRGIVGDNDLWLSNSRYSNDEEELTRGYRIANAAITAARTERSAEQEWLSFLDSVAGLLEKPADEAVYICCFCKFDNLLSQWRGYAANGNGVSIEFAPSGFQQIAGFDSPQGGLMRLWQVFYTEAEQQQIVSDALRFAFDHSPTISINERAQRAADAITFFIPTFKNEDFQREEEWRLIFTPPPSCVVKPRFRVGRNMLVPYYSLKDLLAHTTPTNFKLPITGLLIGPSAQKSLNAASVQALVDAADYDFDVRVSQTPWRG